MGNIGSGEVLVILVLGLLVLGPERLPEFARKIGNFIKEARRMSRSFQEELRNAVEDPDIEMKARAQGALLSQEQNSNDEPENQSS
ncbi:MAG: Sec-independent protein translocase protein TatB [Acidimicrobiales bacterium]|nr:Sec-independent protein translocase protein TatB [Acidimicrobiales bacterium]|tara:strand:+ start:1102 stop:1359 length:258 start_codon:yes stop_codon:yes gene_type:complete